MNNLYLKMLKVMEESKGLEKDLTVGTGTASYRAVGEKEVLNMVKPLFIKNRLIIFPVEGEITEQNSFTDFTYKDEVTTKARNVTQLKVYYKIVDVDTGESETIVGFGNGADSQDKGSGKAFTYSFKTALSKSFMLFSGEDTDNTHSDDIGNENTPKPTTTLNKNIKKDEHICRVCKKNISDAELKFSLDNYGKPLCMTCQKKEKA